MEMSLTSTMKDANRTAIRRAIVCSAAVLLLPFLPQGIAAAQSAAGPLPAAAPSDQPAQAPSVRSTSPVAGQPNLAGTWKLNTAQSDDPMQKMREAQQDSDGQGGGGGRRGGWGQGGGGGLRGGRWGGGGSGGDGQQNGGDQQNGEARRRSGVQDMARLVIEQTATSTKVSDASGRVIARYLAPSEQENSRSPSSSGDANATPVAQWQDNKLVTTQQMPNGGTTTHTYEMSSDTKQIIVTTRIENKRFREPLRIRQVYDPVYASTGGD